MNGTTRSKQDRRTYEADVADQLDRWQDEINRLRLEATDRDVPEDVGDEQTQVEKLKGQLEMAMQQFNQLCAVDTPDAWDALKPGLDEKLKRLDAALARTRAQLHG